MRDQWNREIDYLRISITDRCNLRCRYCMPEEGVAWFDHSQVLMYEEIIRLCGIFHKLGIRKVKVTGGEPLVRKGVAWLIKELKEQCRMDQVTLTTNGVLLKQQIGGLREAGLDGVNVSLDTLNREKFLEITRRDLLAETLDGLWEALKYPNLNVKINCVPATYNLDEVTVIAGLAKEYPLTVRFIELMPIGQGQKNVGVSETEILELLKRQYGELRPYGEKMGNGPAHYYEIPEFQGKIGFISAISHKFCGECNRVRMTSDGGFKTCLQYGETLDLRSLLRSGASDAEIQEQIEKEILKKPQCHHFEEVMENRKADSIGNKIQTEKSQVAANGLSDRNITENAENIERQNMSKIGG